MTPASDDAARWMLMDGRAEFDMDRATVLLVGTCAEVCESANSGEYGKGCIPVSPSMEIDWSMFRDNPYRWEPR